MRIKFLIVGGVAFALQTTVLDSLAVLGARPDLMLLLMLFACFTVQDTGDALRISWLLGLAKDFGAHGGLGWHALLFLGSGYLVLMVRPLFFRDDFVSHIAIAFVSAWLLHWLEALAVLIFTGTLYWGDVLVRVSMIALYTASLAPFVWKGLARLRWQT